jgi:hypothetical protein
LEASSGIVVSSQRVVRVKRRGTMAEISDEWINEQEFAKLCGRTRRTLRNWRRRGIGPPFSIAGKSALYRRSSWPEFLKSIEVKPVRNTRRRTVEHTLSA